jgi:hypothetical protein
MWRGVLWRPNGCALLHGSADGRSQPASTFMRDERTPAAQAPACGSATRQQWPPQSSAAFGPRAQRVTDHSLVAADIGLHQGTPIVTRCPLPAHAASLGDHLQVPVALSRRGLCGRAWRSARTWRHNDRRIRMPLADLTVDIAPVVRSIAGKRRKPVRQPAQARDRPASRHRHPCWSARRR